MRKANGSASTWLSRLWVALLFSVISIVALPAFAQSVDLSECHTVQHVSVSESLNVNTEYAQNADDFQFYFEPGELQAAGSVAILNDLRIQLWTANAIYHDVLGLTPPLDALRYQKAGFVMVILRKDRSRGGKAYDEVVRSAVNRECHIRMALGGQVEAVSNLTPAHELFHLYLNAQMMFKQSWLQEGLARWSEGLFIGRGGQRGDPLPSDDHALEALLKQSYEATSFWQRLFYLVDPDGEVMPDALEKPRYHNGKPVVTEGRFHGATFIAQLFAELDEASRVLAEEQGWLRYNWSEDEQHNLAYSDAILGALYRAVSETLPAAEQPYELRTFMQLIDPSTPP